LAESDLIAIEQKVMGGAVLLSFFVHAMVLAGFSIFATKRSHRAATEKLTMRVIEPKVEEVIPHKPKEKPKPQPKDKVASEKKVDAPKPEAKPILGLDKSTLEGPGTIAVPIGNTLMKEDDGTRVKDAEKFQGDMSSEPRLISSTFAVPKYTDEAIDAGLEGAFVVDVFVTENGDVREAELRKKIGYGMDERVLDSTRKAKFTPRKNKFGKALSDWAEIKVRLVIP